MAAVLGERQGWINLPHADNVPWLAETGLMELLAGK